MTISKIDSDDQEASCNIALSASEMLILANALETAKRTLGRQYGKLDSNDSLKQFVREQYNGIEGMLATIAEGTPIGRVSKPYRLEETL